MSVNYSVPLRTSRLQLVINAIDAGASNGFMRLLDIGGNVLSSLQLSRPSATVANGVASFNGLALIDPAAAVGGSVAFARMDDSNGNIVISGLTLNQDFFLQPTSIIAAGQTIAITAATITGN